MTTSQNQLFLNLPEEINQCELEKDIIEKSHLPPNVDSNIQFNGVNLFAVYCFIKNFVGASVSCTAATIDTKIEHALDVVKNHLTQAVRLEVEELKVKISELVDRISYLEYENDMLRGIIAPDVLANLDNGERDN